MTKVAVGIAVVLFTAPMARATISAVGKTTSSVSTSEGTPVIIPATPLDFLSVAVPKRYRSDKDFLKITTNYQAWCYTDVLYSTIAIGSAGAEPDPTQAFWVDREWAAHAPIAFNTRHWFVAPSSLGGPSIPSDAVVTLKLRGDLGNGCAVSIGSMVVEIGR